MSNAREKTNMSPADICRDLNERHVDSDARIELYEETRFKVENRTPLLGPALRDDLAE